MTSQDYTALVARLRALSGVLRDREGREGMWPGFLSNPVTEAADAIEALTREVGEERDYRLRIQHASQAQGIKDGHAIAAAESEVVRLQEALTIAMEWINGWDPAFIFEPDWPDDKAKIDAALTPPGGEEGK